MKEIFYILCLVFLSCLLSGCSQTAGAAPDNKKANSPGNRLNLNTDKYVPVLMYHSFTIDTSDSAHISPERFRDELKYLKEKGYTTITLNQFLNFLAGTEKLPSKPLMVTMDDSLIGQYQYAYPILQQLDMKAINFAIVSSIGENRGEIPEYNWEQAREMEQSGVFDIESHTFHSHRIQRGLSILAFPKQGETRKEYTERIRNDLKQSKEMLEKKLDKEVIGLAYPFGEWNPIVKKIAKNAGFKSLFSVQSGVNYRHTSPFFIKRIAVDGAWTPDELYHHILSYG